MNNVFGKKLGQYVLLEQLGQGGMAKVYNAFDSRVERNVAIKVILPSKRTSSIFLQQFEREAKALANLTHTNIVKVLNYGVQDGQPYLVMEYVPGGTLKDAMDQKLPWQTAAAILAPIARALDYVHRQQIVHRDVKPSNILLQDDFRPMLSDFGILKILEGKEEKVESAIGAGIGTPEYMAPEQGMGKEVDFRADIYSLGLVFYEMITGQKPYVADTPMAVVIKHVTDELPLPTQIDKNIPKFVERVILRAVHKNPKNRYLSMGHFADALELIALGEKASARRINKVSREKARQQRSMSIKALSALLLVLLAGMSLLVYNYFKGISEATPPATAVSSNIPAVLPKNTPTVPVPTPTSALLTTQVPTLSPSNPVSRVTLLGTPIIRPVNSQFNEIARWGIGEVNVVQWSPDGKILALGTTSGLFLYDGQTHEFLRFIDTQFNVIEMSFNPLSGEIAAGSPTGIVRTWNPESGELIQSFAYTRPVSDEIKSATRITAITYSSDGKHLAVGYQNGAINYFPSNQGNASIAVENYPAAEDLAISADIRFIYASNGSKDIYVWDIQTHKKSKVPLHNTTEVDNLSLSNNQQLLLAGGQDGTSVSLWDLSEETLVSSFSNLGGRVTDFDFSSDDQYVAIALRSGEIKVFKTPGPAEYSSAHPPVQSIPGGKDKILSLAFSPNGLFLASAYQTEGLKIWDAQSGEKLFALDEGLRGINALYLSSDGLWLATEHKDGQLRVWDVNKAKEAYPAFQGSLPKGVPFSQDNRFLVFLYPPEKNRNAMIGVMELKTGNIVAKLPNSFPKPLVQFTADTSLLVIGVSTSASLWDVATWEQLDTHGGPTVGCGQFFTPQNERLATIYTAGILFLYDQKIENMCSTKPPNMILAYYFYVPHRMLFILESGHLLNWGFNSVELNRTRSTSTYSKSSEIFLAADQATGWYAYKDVDQGKISLDNINGGTGTTIDQQEDYQYQVALQPAQKLMALGSRYGSIHIWTMP
jgi:serine/threonine protein kinase